MSFGREIGKRVGGALYVHRDAIVPISQTAERVRAAEQLAGDTAWNVAKIEKISVSLLQYESFDHDFPALLSATTVNLQSGSIKRTDYRGRHSPPILHRKELLLAPTDARLPRFRALTATAEEYGLFRDATKIGTRALWNAKLAAAGLTLREGRLVRADEEALQIARHRTAIIRRDLSQPMQLLMRAGIMSEQQSLFDYGCGQGEDVAALTAQGFNAFGWDPHHAPDGPRRPAAIVNLGFVLNVIEDSHERIETLKTAWQFAERALCVSVMVRGRVSTAGHRPYRDGFRTSRGTFQKYFDQQELRAFVAHATGQLPIALAPGIVATFRDKELEQEVLFRLRSRTFVGGALPRPPARARISVVRPTLRERLAPVLDQLRTLATRVGRLPELFEVPAPVQDELSAARVSWTRTIEALEQCLDGDADFEKARDLRRNDLLVHFALMQFPGSPKYRGLPSSIQADVKAFFGGHTRAQEQSRALLFETGNRAKIQSAIAAAVDDQLGGYHGERWFRFRANTLARLPTNLRILVGCAEVLQGGVDACDFVDIDLKAARIAMVTCDDVAKEIPFMIERTTVDLARLKVSTAKFDPPAMPVYFKSKYMVPDAPELGEQREADRKFAATGLFESGMPEPAQEQASEALKRL